MPFMSRSVTKPLIVASPSAVSLYAESTSLAKPPPLLNAIYVAVTATKQKTTAMTATSMTFVLTLPVKFQFTEKNKKEVNK
jgi:hypothetical protein